MKYTRKYPSPCISTFFMRLISEIIQWGGGKAIDQKFVVGILFASFYEGVIEDDNDDDDER